MENQFYLKFKKGDLEIEVSGSEKDFVVEYYQKLIKQIKDIQTNGREKTSPTPSADKSNPSQSNSSFTNNSKIVSEYQEIFVTDEDGNINIVCDIPGKTDSKKTLNIALLYSYALKLNKEEKASVDSIREICRTHACFDKKNFSTHIKNGHPKLYLDTTKDGNRLLQLNRPGEKEAIKLIEMIKQNEE